MGPYRAKLLADQFGQDILDVLDRCDAAETMSKIPGLKPSVAADVKNAWTKSRNNCRLSLPTMPFCVDYEQLQHPFLPAS